MMSTVMRPVPRMLRRANSQRRRGQYDNSNCKNEPTMVYLRDNKSATNQRIGMKLMYSVEYNKHIPSIPVELKATYKLVKLCPLSNGAN
ncbi:hypothetical protein M404DRAFT_717699 [Pisolithus tinctorius Marx 270]|uniref:Uncharacterized protein n=1 Tax=Pisolithus tinctorius Marx 270 TaxID=870435 RepID=A0A0C3JX03_PISTI|nr:hypothetical protein M404DRAFT_717699 [Pisolithus tinctorius Marx 270]